MAPFIQYFTALEENKEKIAELKSQLSKIKVQPEQLL